MYPPSKCGLALRESDNRSPHFSCQLYPEIFHESIEVSTVITRLASTISHIASVSDFDNVKKIFRRCKPRQAKGIYHWIFDLVSNFLCGGPKGNKAFESGDYTTARLLYSQAMEIDPSKYIYPLNRAIANLKLER